MNDDLFASSAKDTLNIIKENMKLLDCFLNCGGIAKEIDIASGEYKKMKIEISREQLVDISNEMFSLAAKESQGWFKWLLFRALSNVLKIDLFKEMCDNESDFESDSEYKSLIEEGKAYFYDDLWWLE